MKRIILAVFCCFVAFAAGRLSVPVGTLTLGTDAVLQGPFVMTDACLTTEDDASNIRVGPGRVERGACRYDKWSYLSAAIGRWPLTDKWWWRS